MVRMNPNVKLASRMYRVPCGFAIYQVPSDLGQVELEKQGLWACL